MVEIWQGNEGEEAANSEARPAHERPRSSAADLVTPEQHPVIRHPPPGGSTLRDHDCPHDGPDIPAALGCDTARQPNLGIEPPERLLEVPDAGLHLGHLEDAGRRVEGEQIDPAALSVDAVARLRPDLPAMAPMRLGPRSNEKGMVAVEETLHVAGRTPPDAELSIGVERVQHATNRSDRVAIDASAFDVGYRGAAQTAAPSEVLLPPAAPLPEHPDGPAKSCVMHGRIVVGVAYSRLTAGFQPQPLEAAPTRPFSPEAAPHRHPPIRDAIPSVGVCLRRR